MSGSFQKPRPLSDSGWKSVHKKFLESNQEIKKNLYKFIQCVSCNTATRSALLIIIYEESDNFSLAAHTSQFGAGAHIQYYPGCPAEGQSLWRGQVWNMPVFSLMTHSTINTLQLSRSACGYGRVYWLLALVSLAKPCRAQLIIFQTGAGGAPVWHMHSTVEPSSHTDGGWHT